MQAHSRRERGESTTLLWTQLNDARQKTANHKITMQCWNIKAKWRIWTNTFLWFHSWGLKSAITFPILLIITVSHSTLPPTGKLPYHIFYLKFKFQLWEKVKIDIETLNFMIKLASGIVCTILSVMSHSTAMEPRDIIRSYPPVCLLSHALPPPSLDRKLLYISKPSLLANVFLCVCVCACTPQGVK